MPQIIPGVACVECLPPDGSGRPRGIRWLPFADPDSRDADGVLGITSGSRTRPDKLYMVREFFPDSPWHGRAFVCRRAGAGEPYHVFLSADGRENDHCDCAAGCYRPQSECVHRAALRAVIENEWLPATFADVPEPESDPFA